MHGRHTLKPHQAGRPGATVDIIDGKPDGKGAIVEATPAMSFRRSLANILGLSLGWCLMVSVMFLQLSTSTVAARTFSGSATATLPAGIMMAAATLSATPGTLLMGRVGRRPVLLLAALGAVGGAALMVVAARLRLLWLLVVGSVPLGVCFAQANNLRFAAVEFAPPGFDSHAISLVVTGALLSSVVGPEVGRHTRHAMRHEFVGTYVFMTGLCVLFTALMAVVEFHRLPASGARPAPQQQPGRQQQQQPGPQQQQQQQPGSLTSHGTAGAMPAAAQVSAVGCRTDAAAAALEADAAERGAGPGPVPRNAAFGHSSSIAAGPDAEKATAPDVLGRCPSGGDHGGGCDGHAYAVDAGGRSPPVMGPRDAKVCVSLKEPPAGAGGKGAEGCAPVTAAQEAEQPRPLSRLFLTWDYLVPTLTAGLAYGGMAGLMTATPLGIADTGYNFGQTTQVIQVHILSMFVPSLFTGDVIRLITARYTMAAGSLVLLAGTAVFFSGARLPVFFLGNSVVGLGWNWAYVGASALLSRTYTPAERFLAQGCADSVVLLCSGLAVVLAGPLYGWLGWRVYSALYMGVNGASVVMDLAFLARGFLR